VANAGARRLRYLPGWAEGIGYRLAGRSPEPEVGDDVLADRVRSQLGPLEKRLDVPHVHAACDHSVVVLHGEVPTEADAAAIESVVREVAGVRGVESHLAIGLGTGTERPSTGRSIQAAQPSEALRRLQEAAQHAGAPRAGARFAVRAVLSTFADRIPADERDQFLGQLPADVRALAGHHRPGSAAAHIRTVPELVGAVTAHGGVAPDHAEEITRSVLGCLRVLTPHESHDVAAVLPGELRRLWTESVPA
jgi:uncharacterized protein (DUF2267 family)